MDSVRTELPAIKLVVEEFFHRDLPGKHTDTVSRWILTHTARIPEKGESLSLDGIDIVVHDASRRRIREVVLTHGSEDHSTETGDRAVTGQHAEDSDG